MHVSNKEEDLEIVNPEGVYSYPGFYYFPDNRLLAASKDGKILNTKTGKILKGSLSNNGKLYFLVSQNKAIKAYQYHRILARIFIGRPSRHLNKQFYELEVNHKDGVTSNNSLTNLEWITGKENIEHSHKTGLHSKDKPVLAMDVLTGKIISFFSSKQCADHFYVHRATFWKHLNDRQSGRFHKNGYIFKYDDDSEWKFYPKEQMKVLGVGQEFKTFSVKEKNSNVIYIIEGVTKLAEFLKEPKTRIWRKFRKHNEFENELYVINVV